MKYTFKNLYTCRPVWLVISVMVLLFSIIIYGRMKSQNEQHGRPLMKGEIQFVGSVLRYEFGGCGIGPDTSILFSDATIQILLPVEYRNETLIIRLVDSNDNPKVVVFEEKGTKLAFKMNEEFFRSNRGTGNKAIGIGRVMDILSID